jgi:uncharacterized protein (TIGR04222 family)
MEKKHLALWEKIAYFNLDDPKAANPFSLKLMTEQKWSLPQTQRNIAEYKKFMFLVMAEPNGASPSKMVDEVWHAHITNTKNYEQFCEKTIGKFVHHNPSKGGRAEVSRHADWYKETLTAYIRHFDAPPPPDIWDYPFDFFPEMYLPENSQFWKPDTVGVVTDIIDANWQPNFDKKIALMTGAAWLLLLLYFGNPFLLKGPEFLVFYFVFAAIGLAFNFLEEKNLHEMLLPEREKLMPKNLSPLSMAWFMDGDDRFLQTALMQTIDSKMLTLGQNHTWTHHRLAPISDIGNPLIAVLQCIETKETQETTTITTPLLTDILRPSIALVKRQWERTKKRVFEIKHLYGIWAIVLCFGLVRVIQGLSESQPVLFLVFAIIAVFAIKLLLTTTFKPEIAEFIAESTKHELQNSGKYDGVMGFAYSGQVPQNVGFDSYMLIASLTAMHMTMPRDNKGASSCGGSSCSSDGGGSCSGGGDGGGGDGGGCGGCGGGD